MTWGRYSQPMAVQRMTVGELRLPQYQFRDLPPFVPFVLENAHLLPGTAVVAVPQLLSLRELVANEIQTSLQRRGPEDHPATAPSSPARCPQSAPRRDGREVR